jgi:hypothetical protein
LLPLYFFIFRIVMLLVLLWNCSIKRGHFVSSKQDRTQTCRKSEPFARRHVKEIWCWWLLPVRSLRAVQSNERKKMMLRFPILKRPFCLTGETKGRNKILSDKKEQCVICNTSGTVLW